MSFQFKSNIEVGSPALKAYAESHYALYATPSRRIIFNDCLPDDKGCVIDDTIYIPGSQAYKWMFSIWQVTDKSIEMAIRHAQNKVHQFIDNYKV